MGTSIDLFDKDINLKLFKIGVLFLFFDSMCPWFSMILSFPIFSLAAFFSSLPLFVLKRRYLLTNREGRIILVPLLLLFLSSTRLLSIFGLINQLCILTPVVALIFLKPNFKLYILNFVLKWFSILLAISLFFFILKLIGISLYCRELPIPYEGYVVHDNYFAFITKPDTLRFQSVFLEPGHLTMGLAPLLFIYGYNLRNKYVFILFVAQLFTISLAGIITMVFGYLFWAFSSVRYKFNYKSIILKMIAIMMVFWTIATLFEEDDIFGTLVIERIINFNNELSGRSEDALAIYNKVLYSGDIILGRPDYIDRAYGAGYKSYIVLNGIIGFLFMISSYFSYVTIYKKKIIFFFFIINLMLLLQNSYPLWFCMLFNCILGSNYLFTQQTHRMLVF